MRETSVQSLGWEDPPEEEILQYSCLEHSMDRGAWWAAVQGVAKSQIRLSNMTNIMYIRQCRGDEGEKVRVR